jgi:hypothetical protein
MFAERLRSHHDGEHSLDTLLGKPKGPLGRILAMKSWADVENRLHTPPPPPENSLILTAEFTYIYLTVTEYAASVT